MSHQHKHKQETTATQSPVSKPELRANAELFAALHERLAGTPGVHELAEIERRFNDPNEQCACGLPADHDGYGAWCG